MGKPRPEIYLIVDVFVEGFHFWLLLLIDFFLSFFLFFFEIQELYIILIPKGEGECRQFKGEQMMFKKDKWALQRTDERYDCCLCSVAKSCPVLCDPMDCSINRFLNVAYFTEKCFEIMRHIISNI